RLLGRPRISTPGLFDQDDPEPDRIAAEVAAALADLPASLRRDDAALTEAARAALRRALGKRLQKRPLVEVHVLRVP
ncbi:MAG TPA: MBL fold metallo-hydrolase, partial [Acetobacteraceae bacterium]|nr:MBL fold metallo-hydrolase [Acetobacteraceae bacterium]